MSRKGVGKDKEKKTRQLHLLKCVCIAGESIHLLYKLGREFAVVYWRKIASSFLFKNYILKDAI